MIVKNYEIKNYIDKNNIFLIYGQNQGLKEEIILNFSSKYSRASIFKYNEKEVLANSEILYDNLLSQSFFNKEKLILIENISDKFLEEIKKILTKNISDVILVLISSNLDKKSKIRNYFEKEKNLFIVPVYNDDSKTLHNIAYSFFKSKKIKISSESINLIVERSSEDRKNLKNELDKIENFVDNKKILNFEDIETLTNLTENYGINKLVDLSLSKNKKLTLRALNENIFSQEDVIIIIRSFLIKSKRLLKLSLELEKNKSIDQVITSAKPPIFWKDKDIVKKQLEYWTNYKIKKLIKKINNIELIVKKNSIPSLNILQDFIIEQSSKANN